MEAISHAAQRVNEAVMGGEEPVSVEGAPAMVCIKTFMPNPGQERELEEALYGHFNALKEAGLVRTYVCALEIRAHAGVHTQIEFRGARDSVRR